MADLGRVLLVANPAAQNGRGAKASEQAAAWLRDRLPEGALTVARTSGPRHATALVARAEGFDTVVALGGDGVIHEAANGLMERPAGNRPALGVLPVGSGNDYARTLGVSFDLRRACDQLLGAEPCRADVGRVNSRWFVETLSFGLDAAIALDTMERRVRTGRTGTVLYMEAGFDQLMNHLDAYGYALSIDGGEPERGRSITFAVQIGPYYGGGFKVCPDASIERGAFSLCIAHPPVSRAKAAYIFLRAKGGHHTGFKPIEMLTARRLRIEFDEEPPAQMDGERIEGRAFDVELHPEALRVLVPSAGHGV